MPKKATFSDKKIKRGKIQREDGQIEGWFEIQVNFSKKN